MSIFRLMMRSLWHYRRTGIVIALGVAVATAVITGSLLVGNSVTGSLRDTALARLGSIDYALVAPHFFREKLADDLRNDAQLKPSLSRIAPLIVVPGAVPNPASDAVLPNANLIGIDSGFHEFYPGQSFPALSGRECAINAALARDLGVQQGDSLLVNLDRQAAVPAGNLFAHRSREETLRTTRVRVAAVLPDEGAGGFSLSVSTSTPRNLFLTREWLQSTLGKDGKANVLVIEKTPGAPADVLPKALIRAATLEDYGLKLVQSANAVYLQSEALLLTDAQVNAAQETAKQLRGHATPISVYLATKIAKADGTHIAYAIVAAPFPPYYDNSLYYAREDLHDTDIKLNRWAADDLKAKIGDAVRMTYLIPHLDGTYSEDSVKLRVARIVEMAGDALDRGLTPDFEGMTNADSIGDWKTPFPVDLKLITPRDDAYWSQYKALPKAYISMELAKKLWQSGGQGGYITAIRVSPFVPMDSSLFQHKFAVEYLKYLSPEDAGLAFRPVRRLALKSAQGSTDFGELFLSMSFFLVLAAAGLAGMLMRLMADRRAAEVGIMLATGFPERAALAAVRREGTLLAAIGAVIGAPLGILYAWGIMRALTSWWIGAVGTRALWLHLDPGSVLIGVLSGLIVGLLAVWWGTRALRRRRVLDLLAGWQAMAMLQIGKRQLLAPVLLFLSLIGAAALILAATVRQVIPAEGAFFGSGALLLVAGLSAGQVTLRHLLHRPGGSSSLAALAWRGMAANRGRSLLAIGLLASAAFIIVAVAANTRDLSRLDVADKRSGAGGFTLRAISSLPIYYDLGTPNGRKQLGFSPEDEKLFAGVEVMPFLMSPGEDISCLNIAKATQPRLLGVSHAMVERGGFTPQVARSSRNPWQLLEDNGKLIPAFGDADTVMWQLYGGLGKDYAVTVMGGKNATLRFSALIPRSIFAGELLVSEEQFKRLYPGVTAPRYFLIATPPDKEKAVAEALRRNLGEMGMEVRPTREVLNEYLRVQNTYLSTFLALGGLGILLGTFGLVILLLRNAFERRGEFALMLATGFSRRQINTLLLIENTALLVAGLLIGTVAALIAVAPQIRSSESAVNWGMLAGVLMAILALGLISSLIAVGAATRGDMLAALREE